MAAGRASPLLFIVFLLLSIFSELPLTCHALRSQRTLLDQAQRQQQKSSKPNQIQNCSEIAYQSRCKSNPKCRWCRSNVLDDMCASKLEAWRLPSQVFTCD